MNFDDFLHTINDNITKPLAGAQAHNLLMNLQVRKQIFKDVKHQTGQKEAAVLVLLYPDANKQTNMVFILRTSYNGHHAGQIAFPGGKKEDLDIDFQATALRETQEEIGVSPDLIEVKRALTPLFIPISNFKVYPFLAIAKQTPDFSIDPKEVQRLIELPFKEILYNDLVHINHDYFEKSYELKAFQIGKYRIWGATAMILAEVVALLK